MAASTPMAVKVSDRARRSGRGSHGAQTRYVLRLLVCTGLLWVVPALFPGIERIAVRATLSSLKLAARSLTPDVRLTGDTLEWGAARIRIVAECTSLSSTMLYFGAILAYARGWAATLLGAVAGAAVLWTYNLLRIGALLVVLRRWPRWFDVAHVYLWQSVSLVIVLGCFLAWVRLSGRRPA